MSSAFTKRSVLALKDSSFTVQILMFRALHNSWTIVACSPRMFNSPQIRQISMQIDSQAELLWGLLIFQEMLLPIISPVVCPTPVPLNLLFTYV